MRALSNLRPLGGSQLSFESIEHCIEDQPLPLLDRGKSGTDIPYFFSDGLSLSPSFRLTTRFTTRMTSRMEEGR